MPRKKPYLKKGGMMDPLGNIGAPDVAGHWDPVHEQFVYAIEFPYHPIDIPANQVRILANHIDDNPRMVRNNTSRISMFSLIFISVIILYILDRFG